MPPLRQGALTIRERRRPEEAGRILTYKASSGLFFLVSQSLKSFLSLMFLNPLMELKTELLRDLTIPLRRYSL